MKSLLLISPPKSGTTWVRDNMSKVVGVSMTEGTPYQVGNSRWSINSVSSFLTYNQLENWKKYNPRVLFLFREPVSRYWSFLKHNFRYRENHFADQKFNGVKIENVAINDWILAAFHPMSIAHANYDEIYSRASCFFPVNDIRIEFFDSIVETPREFINKLSDWVGACRTEVIPTPPANAGIKLPMPTELGKLFLDLSVCSFSPWEQGQFMGSRATQLVVDQFRYYRGY